MPFFGGGAFKNFLKYKTEYLEGGGGAEVHNVVDLFTLPMLPVSVAVIFHVTITSVITHTSIYAVTFTLHICQDTRAHASLL